MATKASLLSFSGKNNYGNRLFNAGSTAENGNGWDNYSVNSDNNDQNRNMTSIFTNLKNFKDVTNYRLMRGVPDFGSLVQFNPYESGYACFIVCAIPRFLRVLAQYNAEYDRLIKNWTHIVEYEFKSFDGLEDINADTIQLGDDLNQLNVISKVNMQSASEFSLTYDEKSGGTLTRLHRLFMTGIKDPRSQVKTYHGLIHNGILEPGFENECFTFLFINTDNTMMEVEQAYLIIAAQLNSAEYTMYNYTKGDIGKKEVTVKFSGYPIQSRQINKAAQAMMEFLLSADAGARQIIVNSNNFNYTGVDAIAKTLKGYGAGDDFVNGFNTNPNANFTTSSFYSESGFGGTGA